MELRQSLPELGEVRVLCLPMGAISPGRFDYYLTALRQSLSCIQLESLNFSQDKTNSLSLYVAQTWTGAIRFRYLSESKFDSPASVHLSRHYLMVFGITEQSHNIQGLYVELETLVQELNHVLVWKLFSFEPEVSHSELENTAPHLINFYPGQDESHLLASLETVLHDLSFFLVISAAQRMQHLRDSTFDIRLPEDDESKLRKRREGRVEKLCGDLCALAGVRSDAEFHYKKAYELQKYNNDYAWMGGTMECLAMVELLAEMAKNGGIQVYSDWIVGKLKEAMYFYSKGKEVLLQAESSLRFTRYIFDCARRREALEFLMKSIEWVQTELPPTDKIAWIQEAGLLCISSGYSRKGAFLLRIAARLCLETGNHTNAYQLLMRTAKVYQLAIVEGECGYYAPPQTTSSKYNKELYRYREKVEPWKRLPRPQGWAILQHEVLKDLRAAAHACCDLPSEALCLSAEIQLLHTSFSTDKLHSLRIELEARCSNLSPDISLPLFLYPLLLRIEPIKSRHQIAKIDPEAADLFLFSPWDQEKLEKELNWTVGSILGVNVYMQNVFPFDVTVDKANLVVEGRADCLPCKWVGRHICDQSEVEVHDASVCDAAWSGPVDYQGSCNVSVRSHHHPPLSPCHRRHQSHDP